MFIYFEVTDNCPTLWVLWSEHSAIEGLNDAAPNMEFLALQGQIHTRLEGIWYDCQLKIFLIPDLKQFVRGGISPLF